jgi:UDPglucose 6-dehydrogenase
VERFQLANPGSPSFFATTPRGWSRAAKGGTDDIRESPALAVVEMLLREGCDLRVFDPAAMERARPLLPQRGVTYCESAYDAATRADALLILTDWKEFAALELERLRALMAYPIVVDGRNLYDPAAMSAAGFIYYSIGRTALTSPTSLATKARAPEAAAPLRTE